VRRGTTSKSGERLKGSGKKCQGAASQGAEKLVRAVGRGFIPGKGKMKSTRASALAVCFSQAQAQAQVEGGQNGRQVQSRCGSRQEGEAKHQGLRRMFEDG
jgi:uncharacterized protein YcfJ